MSSLSLAHYLDHTLLKAEALPVDILQLCKEAHAAQVFAVCVSPTYVSQAAAALNRLDTEGSSRVQVAAVAGFPSGAHHSSVKAREAGLAIEDGATEVDMVINLPAALGGHWSAIRKEIVAVREATSGSVLKVILETALLTDEQIRALCEISVTAGADFVKTSTGVHAAGGATLHAVSLMAASVDGNAGVKASGGIKTLNQVEAFIRAGATRLGTSATVSILAEALER